MFPTVGGAVEPVSDADLKKLKRMLQSASAPSDRVKRQPLALDFAVLLTRSSYAETAQLDIIPVNQLERDMYRLRTEAYEPYKNTVSSLRQGDLTDPAYFDFMSAVQYTIINRSLKDPETSFDELQPEADELESGAAPQLKTVHVERSLPDDALVSTFTARVGKSILDFIVDRYKGTPIGLPSLPPSTSATIADVDKSLTQLVKIFLINGFAWEGSSQQLGAKSNKNSNTATFVLTLQGPATLWSANVLSKQKAAVRNDFLRQTAEQLVQSLGYSVTSSSVKIQSDQEITTLTIQKQQ